MSRRMPAPSPSGRNSARLYLSGAAARAVTPAAAYDEAPEKNGGESLLAATEYVRTRLSEEDFAEFCRLAGVDPAAAMDSDPDGGPEPFEGMPRPGGSAAMDSRRRSFAERFPNAARIKVST